MTDWYDTTGLSSIRATLEMTLDSGASKTTVCFQYSNDKNPGATWTDTTVGLTSDGIEFGDWADISSGQQLYIRFGVKAEQESGTALQMATVSLRVDMK